MITFTVYGVPIPKGSMRAFMRPGMRYPVVTHDNPKTKPWQEAIVTAGREAMAGQPPYTGAVALNLAFFVPRPKSLPKRVTESLKKPDMGKLQRCVEDGLTRAGVYRDDAQVVSLVASKAYAGGVADPEGEAGIPRVEIRVEVYQTRSRANGLSRVNGDLFLSPA